MNESATDDSTAAPAVATSAFPDRIVVGVDGTESSLRALDMAALVARRNEASVKVVFVRHIPALGNVGAVGVDWSFVFSPLEKEVRKAAEARLAGIRWDLIVTDGSPAYELERIAVETKADLLVVGRSQGGRIHRLLEGSVGGHAASGAPVAVLVAR